MFYTRNTLYAPKPIVQRSQPQFRVELGTLDNLTRQIYISSRTTSYEKARLLHPNSHSFQPEGRASHTSDCSPTLIAARIDTVAAVIFSLGGALILIRQWLT